MNLHFKVNRHGERTPDSDELSLSDQQDKIRKLTYIEGLEGLTNVSIHKILTVLYEYYIFIKITTTMANLTASLA